MKSVCGGGGEVEMSAKVGMLREVNMTRNTWTECEETDKKNHSLCFPLPRLACVLIPQNQPKNSSHVTGDTLKIITDIH